MRELKDCEYAHICAGFMDSVFTGENLVRSILGSIMGFVFVDCLQNIAKPAGYFTTVHPIIAAGAGFITGSIIIPEFLKISCDITIIKR